MKQSIIELAQVLDKAAMESVLVSQISSSQPLSIEEAYEIQKESIGLRMARGEELLGYKLGFTSKEKMEQMGVHDMIWGRLTDAMLCQGKVFMDRHIHPRA